MTFLTRWTAADLKELVTTVGTAIGVLPEKDGGNVSAMVARSVRERIDADSTNTVLIANLSKALETIRRFEDVINGARQQVWRAAVHHTGQVDVAVKLLRHWSATADERWEEQFREDLECLAKWIISGEFATLTGERTPRMEEDSPHE